jgi:hypothetical protein
MPESVPARTKSPAPQRASARPAAAPSLSVRYWKRMRPNKVYPVVVSSQGRGETAPVTVRVIMAGAQVVPAEQTLNPGLPGEKVTFYVTPLARGSLRGERVEILQDGQKIQELRIPCKVCTQKPTLIWLLFTFLLPWLLIHFFATAPVGYQAPIQDNGREQYVDLKTRVKNYAPGTVDQDIPEKRSHEISDFIAYTTPNLDPLFDNPRDDILVIYKDVQQFPEKTYLWFFRQHRELGQPIAFYLFAALLFVTFISFVLMQEGRRTVYGKPLPLAVEED